MDVFPAATRRIYTVHYKRNYKKLYTSPKLNMLLSRAANVSCEANFHKFMESSKKESLAAYAWLQDEPTEHWYRNKFDPTTKVPDNSTNFVESTMSLIHVEISTYSQSVKSLGRSY